MGFSRGRNACDFANRNHSRKNLIRTVVFTWTGSKYPISQKLDRKMFLRWGIEGIRKKIYSRRKRKFTVVGHELFAAFTKMSHRTLVEVDVADWYYA